MTRFFMRILLLALCAIGSRATLAQEDADDQSPYAPGLIATYGDLNGNVARRLDAEIAFCWNEQAPDERLQPWPFRVTWRGFLLAQDEGSYTLSTFACGSVHIRLAGHIILDGNSATPGWQVGTPVDLEFGWHPLEITYESDQVPAQISLFWSGPKFELEPVPSWFLYHERAAKHGILSAITGGELSSPTRTFERGRQLSRALRCEACHRGVHDQRNFLNAPSLSAITRTVHPAWLIGWLAERPVADDSAADSWSRRMPHFDMSVEEARAITAFLLKDARPSQNLPHTNQPVVEKGRELFLTVGCLACHGFESFGDANLFGGGDLTRIAAKRPATFFDQWLSRPETLNARHRMPVFELTAAERAALVEFLQGLGAAPPLPTPFTADEVQRGGKLFERFRCAACHEGVADITDKFLSFPSPLGVTMNRANDCCREPDPRQGQPGYRLSTEDRLAVLQYFATRQASGESARSSYDVLAERNCLSCHSRSEEAGLAQRMPALTDAFPDLASHLSALTPPSLNGVGDKLHDDAIRQAIQRTGGNRRPWLRVRMPKFNLAESERETLVQHFVNADRIPADHPQRRELLTVNAPEDVGARLVTADGFGCTSCHAVGPVKAPNAPLHTLGPDLLLLNERIRREWYERWVRNPARIVPRMEMPAVQTPVSGVLNDDLDRQLAAVWETLNRPEFRPPNPRPVRIVRRAGDPQLRERACVLTDVLEHSGTTYIKPLLLALPNRHNVLFDLQEATVAGWWVGDAAEQRTRGKSWYWQSAGADVYLPPRGQPDVWLLVNGQTLEPQRSGQFITQFDEVAHIANGLLVKHHLTFSDQHSTYTIPLEQTFSCFPPAEEKPTSGWVRRMIARDLPKGSRLRIRLFTANQQTRAQYDAGTQEIRFPNERDARIRIASSAQFEAASGTLEIDARDGSAEVELHYSCSAPSATIAANPPPPQVGPAPQINTVPGFEGLRLPIGDEMMPTGFSWTEEGELVFSSLKGQVWRLRDRDRDGVEDELLAVSDELAAPYGLVAGKKYIDVINKYALLRLVDEDSDGVADRMITLASGWGHTSDYHDWAVGLEPLGNGGYVIALPCQQDQRSAAAAYLRGQVVELRPSAEHPDQAGLFEIHPLSAGHRFPMGLARNRAGDLFVTDNQGNYNPFNELNHVQPGAHFGFVNALEKTSQQHIPPLTPPVINIPHPWTRSVNGICFLNTPGGAEKQPIFGPFEGQLIGCEFDTKRLVRMSLEKIGDTYQGAVYPFSVEQPSSGAAFIGPVVANVSPRGELYIGCLRDSGWGGANNIGGIVRLSPKLDQLPTGIAEVQARRNGFRIVFTRPIDAARAKLLDSYSISSYRRISTPDYGGPDVDRRSERPAAVHVAADARSVDLLFAELRTGFVYEFHLRNLAAQRATRSDFFPSEAYYTLNQLPELAIESAQ